MTAQIWQAINFLLTANVFFVLAIFVWFILGLVGRSSHVNLGFDLWQSLWEPLFMPAIGVLMAGAIASGIAGKVQQWLVDRRPGAED
jgi:hypothetical protein